MTLGAALIEELRRRRQMGMFFDYAGYRQLGTIDTPCELQGFLMTAASTAPPATVDPAILADWLEATMPPKAIPDTIVWMLMTEPFVGLLLVLAWMRSKRVGWF